MPYLDFYDILAAVVEHHQIHPAPSRWQFQIHVTSHCPHKCVEVRGEQVLPNGFLGDFRYLQNPKPDACDKIPKVVQQRCQVDLPIGGEVIRKFCAGVFGEVVVL